MASGIVCPPIIPKSLPLAEKEATTPEFILVAGNEASALELKVIKEGKSTPVSQ